VPGLALPLPLATPRASHAFCAATARLAVRSLYIELALYPKPGLVSLVDNGSHRDMDAGTFLRSLFALRHYFTHITRAGVEGAPFPALRDLGIAAERRMLQATGGINSHRGAIFCLGMLCAAAGWRHGRGLALSPAGLRQTLLGQWGGALSAHHGGPGGQSHGQRVAALHAVGGARAEMARGLPSVFELALPALESALSAGRGQRAARIDALFSLMANLGDTNVYHRAGADGALLVRQSAQAFLARGGTGADGWERMALDCHRRFVAHRLSPGGAADLLAATCFVHQLGGMG
jgi:triphosphoribosyl-dephospho-CoA synthase